MSKYAAVTVKSKSSWSKKKKLGLVGIIALMVVSILLFLATLFLSDLVGKFNIINHDPLGGGEGNGYLNPQNLADKPKKINHDATSLSEIAMQGNTKSITNVLLIGLDADGGGGYSGQRNDVTMILTINRDKKTITMLSLLRDTHVTLGGGRGANKLNAAYSYGSLSGNSWFL